MKPIKIRNGVVALIKGACSRLQITTRDFMTMHEMVRGKATPSFHFAALCADLEGRPDSMLRAHLRTPDPEFRFPAPVVDKSYTLLYDMVDQLYVQDVTTFFERNYRDSVSVSELKKIADMKCGVCGAFVHESPSGPVCINGHGGAEIEDPLGPDTWTLDPNDEPAPLVAASDLIKLEDRRRQDEAFGGEAPKRQYDPVARPDVPWNDDQNRAFKSVFSWFRSSRKKPVFRMFGFAGTGKTTMAKEVAWVIENGEGVPPGLVLFAAYTGKASSILFSKGCTGASTIHSLIYKPHIDRDTGKVTGFTRNNESPLYDCKLLIVDEVSMVNEEMAMDLLSYGIPILVLGDPFQLKPIKGEGYFTQAKPDVMLKTVERTAKDDPITWLATQVREGHTLKPGKYGRSRVYAPGTQISDEELLTADQIIVGMRTTRDAMNRRYRIANGKFNIDTQFPVKGDRLMCLKNNKQNGLMNGTIWQCTQPHIRPVMVLKDYRNPKKGYDKTNIEGLHFKVRSYDMFDADGAPLLVNTVCSTHHFDPNLPPPNWRDIAGTDQWGFGYAGTTHKAQGSQYDDVLLIDQSSIFSDQQAEHLYTGITRAVKRVRIYL